ncbi:unnamed protein product [Penicillium salamii]|uniref:Uncharacterized protein n=1 Tax=Penicillium salamii TaxID=1612424 RepID=A0A9W4K3P3_9EURO|nr:unnamed protein product [Penicillium salamii]
MLISLKLKKEKLSVPLAKVCTVCIKTLTYCTLYNQLRSIHGWSQILLHIF